MFLYSNHLPRVGTTDAGTWRRLIVVPFNAVIAGNDAVLDYYEELYNKAGGAVLSWIIKGVQRFILANYKINPPECVVQAIEKYRKDNDWLNNCLADRCVIGKNYRQKSRNLYYDYREYCKGMGEYTRGSQDFKAALEAAGFAIKRAKDGMVFTGFQLADDSPWGMYPLARDALLAE